MSDDVNVTIGGDDAVTVAVGSTTPASAVTVDPSGLDVITTEQLQAALGELDAFLPDPATLGVGDLLQWDGTSLIKIDVAAAAEGDLLTVQADGTVAPQSGASLALDDVPVLRLPGTSGVYVSTPDHADLDITGDLDLRVAVAMDDWTPGTATALLAKYDDAGVDQRSFLLRVEQATGALRLFWSTDGTSANAVDETSTASVSATDGDLIAVRATLDVDNGAGGYDVKFYTKATTYGTAPDDLADNTGWTQLGTTVTGGSTTSIHAGAATATVGAFAGGTKGFGIGGNHAAAQVYNGIDGTLAAAFRGNVPTSPRYRDSTGKVWTFNGSSYTWTEQ